MDSVLTLPFPDDEFASELSHMEYGDINDLLEQSSQLYPTNMVGYKENKRETDFIDEFLNLSSVESPNTGIYINACNSTTPCVQTEEASLLLKQSQSSKVVDTDHDYAGASNISQCSPAPPSDSGVSSISSSPKNDNQYDQFRPEHDSSSSSDQLFGNGAFEFDFSDFEIDQINNGTLPGAIHNHQTEDVTLDLSVIDASNLRQKRFSGDSDSCNGSVHSGSSGELYRSESTTVDMDTAATRHTATSVLLPNFKPLVLTAEEQKLLKEENMTIPTDLPLTKYEERVLKKVRRKIRNKKSAMASRQKKKDYIGGLEARVTKCTNLNQALSQRVKQLEQQNFTLLEQLKQVHDAVKKNSSKTTKATTCLMVMILSFGLFIAPSYGPFSIDNNEDGLIDIPQGHRTRKILEHPQSDNGYTIVEPPNSIVRPFNPSLYPKSEVILKDGNVLYPDTESQDMQHENDTAHNNASGEMRKDTEPPSNLHSTQTKTEHSSSPLPPDPNPGAVVTGVKMELPDTQPVPDFGVGHNLKRSASIKSPVKRRDEI
uniref:BZIP domain-containing protein n=1 Tax=Ciona intestinalis TaxID=7719 RepID=H2XJF8_CIOIN